MPKYSENPATACVVSTPRREQIRLTQNFLNLIMNFQPTDILIRQSGGTESIWLSERLIIDICGVSEGQIRKERSVYKKTVRPCDLAKAKDFMPDSGKS